MPELQSLRADHAPAVLAFELANRGYFSKSINDRGDAYFGQFAERHSALLADQAAGIGAAYVLVDEDGSVLGRFNLYRIQDGTAELGYRVAEQVAGRGVATGAVRELSGLAASRHGLRRLRAATSDGNVASQRVLLKAGFVPAGPAGPADLGGKTGSWYELDLTAVADGSERGGAPDRWNAAGAGRGMWMDVAADPRFAAAWRAPEGERATLLTYLRRYRLTMEMKCADLDAGQLASRSVPPSTMSLLGLIRHMAEVERYWFRQVMARSEAPPRYWSDDVPDAEWLGAVADPAVVDEAWRDWRGEVAFAEKFVADSPDLGVKGVAPDGSSPALRSVLVHMIEEYARHCGHADLLRERVDGRVGQ